MAEGCTFALVEATAHRLRYLCTGTGNGLVATLHNATMITDLGAVGKSSLRDLLQAQIDWQAEARHLLCGEQDAGIPDIAHVHRAHIKVTPRTIAEAWAADAFFDTDHAAVGVYAPASGPPYPTAYLDVYDTWSAVS